MAQITLCVLGLLLVSSVIYGQEEGTVALFRNGVTNSSYSAGIVQVYSDGSWEGICNDTSFGINAADVICHQLGFTGVNTYSTVEQSGYGTIDVANYTDIECDISSYQTLFQCDFQRNGCEPEKAVTIQCLTTRVWDDAFDGQVRLQNGDYTSEGTVEIYCNNEWGTLCNTGFDEDGANVVCEQLGYSDGTNSNVSRNVDQPIWLTEVNCNGAETCLSYCQACPNSDMASNCLGSVVSVSCSITTSDTNNNTLGTCDFTALVTAIKNLIGIIVGVVIACCVISIFLALLPFCICCCLGVGIGAAAAKA